MELALAALIILVYLIGFVSGQHYSQPREERDKPDTERDTEWD